MPVSRPKVKCPICNRDGKIIFKTWHLLFFVKFIPSPSNGILYILNVVWGFLKPKVTVDYNI